MLSACSRVQVVRVADDPRTINSGQDKLQYLFECIKSFSVCERGLSFNEPTFPASGELEETSSKLRLGRSGVLLLPFLLHPLPIRSGAIPTWSAQKYSLSGPI